MSESRDFECFCNENWIKRVISFYLSKVIIEICLNQQNLCFFFDPLTEEGKFILKDITFTDSFSIFNLTLWIVNFCFLHKICPIKSNYFVLALKKTYYWHKNKFKFTHSVHSRIHKKNSGHIKEKKPVCLVSRTQLIT